MQNANQHRGVGLGSAPHDLTSLGDAPRLEELARTGLLDSPDEESFDRITRLAERLLDVPVAMVSLVDRDRQFFKSQVGLSGDWAANRESPLTHSFCQYAVASGDRLVIENARESALVKDNPAIDEQGVEAYAGEPLTTSDGHVLGTLCIIDHEPREWQPWELEVLSELSAIAMAEIDFRLRARALRDIEARAAALHTPLKELGQAVHSMANLTNRADDPRIERLSSLLRRRLDAVERAAEELRKGLVTRPVVTPAGFSTVNLGERLLRAAQVASVSATSGDVRVEILDRPLPVSCDAQQLDQALTDLLSNVMQLADASPVEATLCRDDDLARLEVHWLEQVPVSELTRMVSTFDVAAGRGRTEEVPTAASVSSTGRTTTAESGQIRGTTGPDGSSLTVSLSLVDQAAAAAVGIGRGDDCGSG